MRKTEEIPPLLVNLKDLTPLSIFACEVLHMKIQFTKSKEVLLTTHAGLASVGALLSHSQLPQRLNRSIVKGMEHPLHSNGDFIKSYLGLLCQGKSDFGHIEPFRKDPVFQT
ncbi:hypothetical protein [Paenibacillus sp. GCM10027626]|uniref:hypothetical protein n=1 Tax=Paenibacillus sp. GCM10027626 TaxID=3273411 RepID=UPI0036D3F3ED